MKRMLSLLICCALIMSVVFIPRVAAAEQVPAPVAAQISATSIRLNPRSGYEFSRNGQTWSTSNIFYNLTPETEYTFYQRRSGKPETQSEPVVIKTSAIEPCTAPAIAPILDYATTDTIALVDLWDHEYRINGGSWQSIGVFDNLQPDTEYVLEQRVRGSQNHLPSNPSTPLVVKTHKRGESTYTNFPKVLKYIDTYGTKTEDGYKVLAYSIEDEYGGEYILGLASNGKMIDLELFYDGVEEFGLAFDVQLSMSQKTWVFDPTFRLITVVGDTIADEIEATALIYSKEYNSDYVYPVHQNGTYITSDEASELATVGLELLFGFWDEVFYTDLGFGFKGLGLTAYEGLGECVCAPQSGYHLGTLEEHYQRDPYCGIYGLTASTFCTVCGERAQSGQYVAPKTEHTYDQQCTTCSTCGMGRSVLHNYPYSCSNSCKNCGLEREPLSEHQLLANTLCTVCGTPMRLLGDVSGDGKINIGDVSKLYSHIKGTSIITDSISVKASDTNGDGKINMGDVSKLYSQIKSTKPNT